MKKISHPHKKNKNMQHTHTHVYTHACMHTHARTHTHTYIHTHTHAHTRTHTLNTNLPNTACFPSKCRADRNVKKLKTIAQMSQKERKKKLHDTVISIDKQPTTTKYFGTITGLFSSLSSAWHVVNVVFHLRCLNMDLVDIMIWTLYRALRSILFLEVCAF